MIDATRIPMKAFRLVFCASTLACALTLFPGPAPARASVEDGACFTDPAPECAAPIMQRALTLARSVTSADDRDRVLVIFASLQSRLGDLPGARKSVDAIQGPAARKAALTHVVSNAAGRVTADETLALAASYGGGWLTGHALYAISAQLAVSGDLDAALSTAITIQQDDRRAKALEHVIGTLIASGDLNRTRATAEKERNDEIRSRLLLTIAGAHLGSRDLVGAYRILVEITGEAQRTELLIGLAMAQAQHGNLARALAAVDEIETRRDQETALAEIAAIQTFRRDFEGALAVARKLADETLRKAIKVRIIAVRAEAGDIDRALQEAGNLKQRFLRDEALHRIAMTLVFRHDIVRAAAVVDEIQDDALKAEIMSAAALAEQRAGNDENALSIAGSIRGSPARARTLLAIAEHRQTSYASPEDILSEVENLIADANDAKVRDDMLSEYSGSLARIRLSERAVKTAEKISAAAPRGKAKAAIATSLAFFGKHEHAATILTSIENAEIRANARQSLAKDAVMAGKPAAAMAYAKAMEEPGRRAILYGFVAETLLRSSGR